MATARPDSSVAAAPATHSYKAFGLAIHIDAPVPGLPAAAVSDGGRESRIRLVDGAAIRRAWPKSEATRVDDIRLPTGRIALSLDQHPEAGYYLTAARFGRFLLAPDGSSVLCAPYSGPEWPWQRLLLARVLPLTAILRGYEIFHASAVELDGAAVAFVAQTGVGKTSLAVNLVLRGATFMADDVLSLEATGDEVLAHSGPTLVSIRHAESRIIGERGRRAIGRLVSRGNKTYLEVERDDRCLPLKAIYYLRRETDESLPLIAPIDPPDPRWLLSSSFLSFLRTPQRGLNQLDVCAKLSQSAREFEVAIPPHVDAAALAAAVEEHALATIGELRA